jgi:hypothetical protein
MAVTAAQWTALKARVDALIARVPRDEQREALRAMRRVIDGMAVRGGDQEYRLMEAQATHWEQTLSSGRAPAPGSRIQVPGAPPGVTVEIPRSAPSTAVVAPGGGIPWKLVLGVLLVGGAVYYFTQDTR